MNVIRFGRGKEDAVDLAPEDRRQPAVLTRPERLQNFAQRLAQIIDRGGAVIQRRHQIDQHDLPVERREMIAKKGFHDAALISFEPLFELRIKPVARRRQRTEAERGRPFKIPRHQKAPRRKARQPSLTA